MLAAESRDLCVCDRERDGQLVAMTLDDTFDHDVPIRLA